MGEQRMKKSMKRVAMTIAALGLSFAVGVTGAFAAPDVARTGKGHKDLLSPDRILNVAHRGASGHAPEHTIVAYHLAKKMKADYIEIDLQMTKDGHLIAMHDETLDRTTNGTGLVKDHTLAEIKRLDAGSWFNEAHPDKAKPAYKGLKVPTLDEVLRHFGHSANYYIETKAPEIYPGMEEKLLKTLEAHRLIGKHAKRGKVIIQSFSPESLKKIHALNPEIPLVTLLWYENEQGHITKRELDEIKTYAIGVGANFDRIDRAYVQKVRKSGLLFHPYTVNEKPDMKRMLDWGATGMFTNYADRLTDLLKKNCN
jgi:glycerophosphoryl diester phosphodiesterase